MFTTSIIHTDNYFCSGNDGVSFRLLFVLIFFIIIKYIYFGAYAWAEYEDR